MSSEGSLPETNISLNLTPTSSSKMNSGYADASIISRYHLHQLSSSGASIEQRRRRSSSRGSSKNLKSSEVSQISMIFRNLLILEDDLRMQLRQQRVLKWKFTLFLAAMAGVAAFSFYELYFSDERVNGLYRFGLQFLLIFIMVTIVLFHLSGEYKRTMVIPRRFFVNANKGMRQFNVKLVKVKRTWPQYYTDSVRMIMRHTARTNILLLTYFGCGKTRLVLFWSNLSMRCQPRIGAVDVKLVLNARAFNADVREGWEIYRDEFWKRETVRRRKQEHQTNLTLLGMKKDIN